MLADAQLSVKTKKTTAKQYSQAWLMYTYIGFGSMRYQIVELGFRISSDLHTMRWYAASIIASRRPQNVNLCTEFDNWGPVRGEDLFTLLWQCQMEKCFVFVLDASQKVPNRTTGAQLILMSRRYPVHAQSKHQLII